MKKCCSLFLAFLLFLPALAGAETVVTSFYPVWLLARSLTAGLEDVQVVNLADPSVGCLPIPSAIPIWSNWKGPMPC